MIVSIFKDMTYVTGADFSYTAPVKYSPEVKDDETGEIISEEIQEVSEKGHPDCIGCVDIEFNPEIQNLEITKKKGKFVFKITEKEIIESYSDKKKRIILSIIQSDEYYSIDTEGVLIEKSDIGPMIIARFFKSDPNAEMAYLQKWNFLTSLPERTEEQQAELDLIKKGYVAKEEFKDFLLSLINK